MSDPKSSEPKRGRKRLDKAETAASFLPEGNPHARLAYFCAIFGMIPLLGFFLGWAAMVYGWLGWRAAQRECQGKGIGHAFVSMVLGALEVVANAVGCTLIAIHFDWI